MPNLVILSSATKKTVYNFVNVIKLFSFIADDKAKYARVFATVIHFHPSLIFARKLGAYHKKLHSGVELTP